MEMASETNTTTRKMSSNKLFSSSSRLILTTDSADFYKQQQQQQQQHQHQQQSSQANDKDWWDRFSSDKKMFYIKLSSSLALLVVLVLCVITYTHSTASDPTWLGATESQFYDDQLVKASAQSSSKSIYRIAGALRECGNIKEFEELRKQIQSHKQDVDRIIGYMLDGPGRNTTFNELALFCDTFGPRMSGSKSLEMAIEYLKHKMQSESKLKVSAEPAMVPNWVPVRGSCELVAPVPKEMRLAILGQSVSTNGVLEAQVVLVHDFNELDVAARGNNLKGKIVVFNHKFTTYPETVKYRVQGALRASKYGAAAALVRSITPFSMDTPHAGAGSKSIPTAAITIEDADLIERWLKRNKTVTIRLLIETQFNEDVKSYNLIGDIPGKSRPQEIVFVSGHMDSWYNTPGAMDDGGGMMISLMALDLLSKLSLRGERTMRAILWTAEEPGLNGAIQYYKDHQHELENFKAVIESDEGTFKPLGLGYLNLGPLGQCVMQEILALTERLQTTALKDKAYEGSDITVFSDAGVPGLSLYNDNERYFWFHHTSADTMEVEDPDALDKSTALFASTVYVLANLDVDLRK